MNKSLDADIWWTNVREETTWSAYFKPDDYPEWVAWRTDAVSPPKTITPIGTVGEIVNGLPTLRRGFAPRVSLTKPQTQYDANSTKRDLKLGYEVHVKLQWTGNARINRFRVMDTRQVESAKAKI
jgi:hypothetical protein